VAFEIANVSKETHNKSRHAQSQDNTEPAEDFLAVNYIEEPRHMIRNKKDGEFVEYGVESPNPTPPELGHSLSEVDHVAFMERRTMHTIQPVNQEMVGLYQGEEHSASIEQPPENVYHTNRYRHDVLDDLPPDYPHQGNQFTHANGLATFDPLYNGFIAMFIHQHQFALSLQGLPTPSTVAQTHDQYAHVNQAPNYRSHTTALQQPAATFSSIIPITNQHSRPGGGSRPQISYASNFRGRTKWHTPGSSSATRPNSTLAFAAIWPVSTRHSDSEKSSSKHLPQRVAF